MKKPKTYEIHSLEDILDTITSDNFEKFLIDMAQGLGHYITAIEEIRNKHPEMCEGKKNSEMMKFGYTWIDDGKNDVKGITMECIDEKGNTMKFEKKFSEKS